jgi:tRNA modification GTPase
MRLSGESALDIAASLVGDPDRFRQAPPQRLQLVDLHSRDGNILDHALCATFCEPHSYTGENAVEFYVHCSPFIISSVIDCCREAGARTAQPGEFTQRAFLNGRMDLAQAEAVADLISAESAVSHRVAISQREGVLSKRIQQLRDAMTGICALIECGIDFSDQDLPVVENDVLLERLAAVEKDLADLKSTFARGKLAREGASVVIAGAPNVGKSTLFNALLKEERAIVHEHPGTTRDAIESFVEWGGVSIRLIDTAGQADDFGGPDVAAIERARVASESADLVLWVVDLASNVQDPPPETLIQRSLVIGNKADLVDDATVLHDTDILPISALKLQGLNRVQDAVMERLLPQDELEFGEVILTHERHFEAVGKALKSVTAGRQVIQKGHGHELLAADLHDALSALSEIVGEIAPDDILNRIFADFCVGK